MSDTTVLYETAEGVATVTLNRPGKLNAFNIRMHGELMEALGRAEEDKSVRALVLTGAGGAFSAGQDLSEPSFAAKENGEGPDIGDTLRKYYNPLIRMLRRLQIPVVAAVNGVAAGASANVALACDIVIAGKGATFIQSFVKVGLIPDAAGSYHLPRLVGRARAYGLSMLGDAVGGQQAADWGMIWKCVDDETLMEEATAIARQLAAGPARTLALIKEALNASESNSFGEQLELERMLQQVAGKTADYLEGRAAFLEKRRPDFKGR